MPDPIGWLDAVNAAHPWSHNDFYHRWVLRQLPTDRPALACLDVGCGTGNLVYRLASRAAHVHGIDTDPASIAIARARADGRETVTFELADPAAMAGRRFDVVTALAVLHHLPLEPTLARLRAMLTPGGRLLIVGCYAEATAADRAVAAIAVPANVAMGLVSARRAGAARIAMSAPTRLPEQSLADVRAAAARLLPGAHVRRRLFWRYTLSYTAP